MNLKLDSYEFKEVCPEFIRSLYKEVVIENWSLGYGCRKLRGGIPAIKRNFKTYPELKEIFTIYLERKKKKSHPRI